MININVASLDTERLVLEALFGEQGLLSSRTVLLVSNNMQHLSRAHHVIDLGEKGSILQEGAPTSFSTQHTQASTGPYEKGPTQSKAPLEDGELVEELVSSGDTGAIDEEAVLGQQIVWPSVWAHCRAAGSWFTVRKYFLPLVTAWMTQMLSVGLVLWYVLI